jgi:ActR/RegA family two-component response regulator
MVQPSCPAFVIHEDDAFRKSLIATLDQHHFTVTFARDGEEAIDVLRNRKFNVVLVGVNLAARIGLTAVDFLRDHRERLSCGVVIVGEPDPALRTYAPWADETLLKPVDAAYVATRARSYCSCA